MHCASGCEFLHLFPACRLIVIGIICEFDDMVAFKTVSTVLYHQREQ